MIPDKFKELIDALIKKTKTGKADWEKVKENNIFKLDFKESGAIILWISNDDEDNLNAIVYSIKIVDKYSNEIQCIKVSDVIENDEFKMIEKLYSAIITYLWDRVNKMIDVFISSLISDRFIGKDSDPFSNFL